MSSESNACAIESILRSWLDDRDLTLFCGDWSRGGVMELIPRGGASLTGRHYDPPFEGLRELRLEDASHHVHLDLGRLTAASYTIAPSVCYGFRPSFELRFTSGASEGFGLGLAVTAPYAGGRLRANSVRRYLLRAAEHMTRFPGVVRFACEHTRIAPTTRPAWEQVAHLLAEAEELSRGSLPQLRAALQGVSGHVAV